MKPFALPLARVLVPSVALLLSACASRIAGSGGAPPYYAYNSAYQDRRYYDGDQPQRNAAGLNEVDVDRNTGNDPTAYQNGGNQGPMNVANSRFAARKKHIIGGKSLLLARRPSQRQIIPRPEMQRMPDMLRGPNS